MLAAAVPFSASLYVGGVLKNTSYPNGPNATVLAMYQQIYTWMVAQLAAT